MLHCEAEKEEIMMEAVRQRSKTYDLVYVSIFVVLIAVCSWISIPLTVPVTLQTFGVFIAVGLLGGKRGTLYILMGAIGIPVFSGFTGGIGILAGTTGGYIVGFLFSALLMWGMEKLFGKDTKVLAGSMILGLAVCYAVGTLWFMAVYAASSGAVGIFTVLGWCVFPFIIPDIAKIALALILTKRLSGVIRR